MVEISVIIPTLNEARQIEATLHPLQAYRKTHIEIIIADGGSSDATLARAMPYADHLIRTSRGRAQQMNAGASRAQGNTLLFLHADSRLAKNALLAIPRNALWGRFNVHLDGDRLIYRVIEKLMNLRSCVTGIATGDQGIFIQRDIFNALQGFPEIPLMEDITMSRQLKTYAAPTCLKPSINTSVRYWETHGIYRSIATMWGLRLAYFMGVSPDRLVSIYYRKK